jgi:hypothetical protein
MLSEDQVSVLVRDQLAAEVADIEVPPDLAGLVRRKLGRRHRRDSAILGLVAALVVVGIAVPISVAGGADRHKPSNPQTDHRAVQVDGPAISLAGYKAHLPSGYKLDAAGIGTCRKFWIYSGPMPAPGATTPAQQPQSLVGFEGAGITGCLSVANSANYRRTPGGTADPVVPKGARALTIGSYHAYIYKEPGQPTVALYVEIPTTGGVYHDLLVGAQGISSSDLIALVQKALPTRFEQSDVKNSVRRQLPSGSTSGSSLQANWTVIRVS